MSSEGAHVLKDEQLLAYKQSRTGSKKGLETTADSPLCTDVSIAVYFVCFIAELMVPIL